MGINTLELGQVNVTPDKMQFLIKHSSQLNTALGQALRLKVLLRRKQNQLGELQWGPR